MKKLTSFRPTNTQKRIIATILSAPTPKVAAETTSATLSLKVARDQLASLGILTYTANGASLTNIGMELAHDENISDESGQLTDYGQQFVGGDTVGKNSMGEVGSEPPIGGEPIGGTDGFPMESLSTLRELMRC